MKLRSLHPVAIGSRLVARYGAHEMGTLAGILAGAGLIAVFGMVAEEVMEGDTHRIDTAILMAFRKAGEPSSPIGPPWLPEMMRDVTALGSYAFLTLVVVCVVGYLALIRKHALSLLMLAAVVGGMLISNALKHGFDRPRPGLDNVPEVFSPSFPSGHATLSAVTFLTLGGLLTRANIGWRVKIYFLCIAVFLTVVVGASRVYLGVHYPSDVLAGWCIGTAWALLCWAVALWLQRRGKIEPAGA